MHGTIYRKSIGVRNFLKLNFKYWELLFLFILSLTPLLWFKDGSVVLGHDSGFRLNPLNYWQSLYYSWNPISNFGAVWAQFKGFLVTQFPETLFTALTGSLSIGERITFIFWFLVLMVSMYVFVSGFFNERKYWFIRIFTSVFYAFNFFLLQGWFIAERAKFSLFAALPLGVLIIFKTLTKEYSLLKGVILFSFLTFFLNGGGSLPLYGGLILAFGITFLYLTLLNFKENGRKEIFFSLKTFFSFIFSAFLINAYWIIPQAYLVLKSYGSALSSVGGLSGVISWEDVISKYATFANLFRLQGIPDWYNNPNHVYSNLYLSNPFLIALSFLPITAVLLGFIFHRSHKDERVNKLYFLVFFLFFMGLVFASGSHPPLGLIYILFIKYIPGFAVFRSAFFKFGPLVWFSVIFLTGYSLNLIFNKFTKNKILYTILAFSAIFIILFYHSPFFNGNFFVWNKPFSTMVKIPHYVSAMSAHIDSKTSPTSRILLLPGVDTISNADSYNWGYWSLDPLPELSTERSIIARTSGSFGISDRISKAIENNNENLFTYLTGVFGINKILWRNDLLFSSKITSKEYKTLYKNFTSFKEVTLEKKIGEWELYSIKSPNFNPVVYAVSSASGENLTQDEIIGDLSNTDQSTEVSLPSGNLGINLNPVINKKTYKAECILCQDSFNGVEQTQLLQYIPPARFLPDSLVYPFIKLREYLSLKLDGNDQDKIVDSYLKFANQRLSELYGLTHRLNLSNNQVISDAIIKYEFEISSALGKAGTTNDNGLYIKILPVLKLDKQYITSQYIKGRLDNGSYNDLVSFVAKKINEVDHRSWVTLSANDLKYEFSLDEDGNYSISLSNQSLEPRTINLDGEKVPDSNNIPMKAGIHRLELIFDENPNEVLDYGQNLNRVISLHNNDAITFGIKDFKASYTYSVSFDYKLLDGKPSLFTIYQTPKDNQNQKFGNLSKTLYVDYNNNWNSFYYVFTPYPNLENVSLQISLLGEAGDKSVFETRDFKVQRVNIPDVSITQKLSVPNMVAPVVSFEKTNPTNYNVRISNATKKFILVLNEGFDNGWRAKINNDDVSNSNHFLVNGFANGWIIDKKGNFDVSIEYWPQDLVNPSIAISILSIVSMFIVYIKCLKRR